MARRAIRGISPVLATLILIVIAVIAGLIVYSWAMGWTRMQLGKVREQLTIRAIYIMGRNYDTGNPKYRLEIENTGDATAEVVKIRVRDEGGSVWEIGVSWRSTPGSLAYLDFEAGGLWEVGEPLDIWVFTKAGSVYEVTGMSVEAWYSYALIIWDVDRYDVGKYYIDLLNIGKGTLTVKRIGFWNETTGEWDWDETPDGKESIVIKAGAWYWNVDVETAGDYTGTVKVRVETDHGSWEGTLTAH